MPESIIIKIKSIQDLRYLLKSIYPDSMYKQSLHEDFLKKWDFVVGSDGETYKVEKVEGVIPPYRNFALIGLLTSEVFFNAIMTEKPPKEETEREAIIDSFKCPISNTTAPFPTINSTGHHYNLDHITKWCQQSNTENTPDPLSPGQTFTRKKLFLNKALYNMMSIYATIDLDFAKDLTKLRNGSLEEAKKVLTIEYPETQRQINRYKKMNIACRRTEIISLIAMGIFAAAATGILIYDYVINPPNTNGNSSASKNETGNNSSSKNETKNGIPVYLLPIMLLMIIVSLGGCGISGASVFRYRKKLAQSDAEHQAQQNVLELSHLLLDAAKSFEDNLTPTDCTKVNPENANTAPAEVAIDIRGSNTASAIDIRGSSTADTTSTTSAETAAALLPAATQAPTDTLVAPLCNFFYGQPNDGASTNLQMQQEQCAPPV